MALGYVAKLLAVRQSAELLQALVLDLPDPLARDVERAADLVERPRLLAVEPVAHLEDPLLPRRERAEDLLERVPAKRLLGRLLRQRRRLVGQEVPELGLLVVADRLLERDRQLRAAPDLLDLVGGQVEVGPISTEVGSRPSSPRSFRSERTILFSFSTTWTGMRIVRDLSASARATAWRIHHVA